MPHQNPIQDSGRRMCGHVPHTPHATANRPPKARRAHASPCVAWRAASRVASAFPGRFARGPSTEEERMHELIRWLMAMGADPRSVANRAEAMSVGLPPSPPGPGWKAGGDGWRWVEQNEDTRWGRWSEAVWCCFLSKSASSLGVLCQTVPEHKDLIPGAFRQCECQTASESREARTYWTFDFTSAPACASNMPRLQ